MSMIGQESHAPEARPTAYDTETDFPKSFVPGTSPVTHRSELRNNQALRPL